MTDPRVRSLASRVDFNIGAYLGVPVVLGGDQLYGTLCVLDPDTRQFDANDLDLLVIVSSWLRLFLEYDHLAGRMVIDAE